MTRTDARPKTRGALEYGTDLSVPGMLWGAYALARFPHARLTRLDLDAARAVPGVRAVLGHDELLDVLPERARSKAQGPDAGAPLLVRGESRFAGEPVAVVAADSLASAREGARKVRAEWEVLPAFTDISAEFPEWPEASRMKQDGRVNAHVVARRGDFDATARGADLVVEEVYRTPMIAQVPLEPHACLAEVRGEDWHVRSSSQTPFGLRDDLSEKLGLPAEKVRVEGTWVGGGFGGKNEALLEAHALLLARATGSPVRLALTFREEFLFTRTTQPAIFWMASAVREGRLVARRTRLLLDTGASLPGRDFALGFALGFTLGPYHLRSWELEGYALRTHRPPFGPHRAPLAPQCTFAAECHLDSVARRMGKDPVRLRQELVWKEGERTHFGQKVPPFAAADLLQEAGATLERWRRELPSGHGLGLALGFWSTGTGSGGEATLHLSTQGLHVLQGEREIGNGTIVEGLRAVAAQATGLPFDAITIDYADTSHAPFDSGVWGSRTMAALGRAVEKGCQQLLRELATRLGPSPKGRAAPSPVRLRLGPQGVEVLRGEEVRPLAELLSTKEVREGGLHAHGKEYGKHGEIDTSTVVEGELYPYADLIASLHVAEVDVDRGTGAVRVVRYAAFQDAGKVVEPAGHRGQVEGGLVMGLGTALTEEGLLTPEGRLLNPGLLDYRLLTIRDVPAHVEIFAREGHLGSGPGGAKGIGEPPIIPVPAAVANAVADATGSRVHELPLTPERVARALGLISSEAPGRSVGVNPR